MTTKNKQADNAVEQTTGDLSNWLSTYGVVTVEKILDRYGVKMASIDLIATLKNPHAMLSKLIQTPLKNVFNGLVLQQAKDYQSYIEKMFIDYLLSGESDQNAESISREDIEQARQDFLQFTTDFQKVTHTHEKVIADSQTLLIQFFSQFHQKIAAAVKVVHSHLRDSRVVINNEARIVEMLYALMSGVKADQLIDDKSLVWVRCDQILGQDFDLSLRVKLIKIIHDLIQIDSEALSKLAEFHTVASEVGLAIKNYRSEFGNMIKRINELFYALGTYQPNPTQLAINQIGMDFDTDLG